MFLKKLEPQGDEEYVTLRMHLFRETTIRESGGVDMIVHRDMLSCINAESEDYESKKVKDKLAEALEKRVQWCQQYGPVVRVEATYFSSHVQNDHVFHCRYDDEKQKWYFRAAKKGKPDA